MFVSDKLNKRAAPRPFFILLRLWTVSDRIAPMTKEENDVEKEEALKFHYELGYLLVPTIPEENLPAEATIVREAIEKYGTIVSGAAPLEKHLAYEIAKQVGGKKMHFQKGYFGHFVFEVDKDGMAEIREAIKKNNQVLRFLLVTRTKESLIAPTRRIPRTSESRPKRAEEKSAPVNEVELDKEIEKMVATVE